MTAETRRYISGNPYGPGEPAALKQEHKEEVAQYGQTYMKNEAVLGQEARRMMSGNPYTGQNACQKGILS